MEALSSKRGNQFSGPVSTVRAITLHLEPLENPQQSFVMQRHWMKTQIFFFEKRVQNESNADTLKYYYTNACLPGRAYQGVVHFPNLLLGAIHKVCTPKMGIFAPSPIFTPYDVIVTICKTHFTTFSLGRPFFP